MPTLSKSDFKLARSCPAKLTWRERRYPSTQDENEYLQLLAEGGYMVEQLARLLFPAGRELHYDPRHAAEAWETTRAALAEGDGDFFEATFLAQPLLARVDILRKRGNVFHLFEVKAKSVSVDPASQPHGPMRGKKGAIGAEFVDYLEDVTYQVHVIKRAWPDAIVKPHLILVNKDALTTIDRLPTQFAISRDGEKDLDIRFVGDVDTPAAKELLAVIDVSSEVDELFESVVTFADAQALRYGENGVAHEPGPLTMKCKDCEYRVAATEAQSGFRECWGPLAKVDPSILDLHKFGSTRHDGEALGDKMIAGGRIAFDDVDPRHLVKKDGSATVASGRQLVQIEYTQAKKSWYGADLAGRIRGWQYPIHFIDFETSGLALPYHAGMRPYQSVAFQWSCHTIPSPGAEPVHTEWLNTTDLWPSHDFAVALREAIGDTGSVIIWTPYERTILRAVRDQLLARGMGTADLVEWLTPFADKDHPSSRIIDQHQICLDAFFHPRMAGRTSIKKTLDAIWQDDPVLRENFDRWMGADAYHVPDGAGPYEGLPPVEIAGTTLDVANGTDAMRAYQAMLYGDQSDSARHREVWSNLLRRYCKLDTLAMVLIWEHWLRNTAG